MTDIEELAEELVQIEDDNTDISVDGSTDLLTDDEVAGVIRDKPANFVYNHFGYFL